MHLTALFNVWKKDLIRIQLEGMEISSEKTFSMILQIFSISENILKFTLFRNVLLPLNEKYSGLPSFTRAK